MPFTGDVSDEKVCEALIAFTLEKFGTIDILMLSQGISAHAKLEDITNEMTRKIMEVNYYACVYLTKLALPTLR